MTETWSTRQIRVMNELIDDARETGHSIRWIDHLCEIGHSLHAVRKMAHALYAKRRDAAARQGRELIRALADGQVEAEEEGMLIVPDDAEIVIAPEPPPSNGTTNTYFARPTPVSTLMRHAELRGLTDLIGLTGALQGDPLPGRSALDEKRAGIARTAYVRRDGYNNPKSITLATRPWRDNDRSARA